MCGLSQQKIYLNTCSRLDEFGSVFDIYAAVRVARLRGQSSLVLHVNVPPFKDDIIVFSPVNLHGRLAQFT